MHENVKTVQRLLKLAEKLEPLECGVPLCDGCCAGLLRELGRQLEEAEAERELLQSAYAELEASDEAELPSAEELSRLESVHESELVELRAELTAARAQREGLTAEVVRLHAERAELALVEEERHRQLNALELERQRVETDERRTADLIAHCELEISRLEAVDVYQDVFDISSDGAFGTINGNRLGRLPGVSVEWSEINAALGQAVLLLHTFAKAHGVSSAYVLHPMGSFSKIARLDEPRILYELYGSGSAPLGRLFGIGRFDRGLAMVLACAKELFAFTAARPRPPLSLHPPHPVEDDLVGGVSIRLQFNQEEKWTAAFRNLLEDLRWLLQWRVGGHATENAHGSVAAQSEVA